MKFEKLRLKRKIETVTAGHPQLMSLIVGVAISLGIVMALTYIETGSLGQIAEAWVRKPVPG